MLISIVAIHNFDSTIFDNFQLPTEMNKETLVNMILLELGELSVYYSQPNILKFYIEHWSKSRLSVWQHLWDLAMEEYDPLDNYNRTDTVTTDHGHKLIIDRANTENRQDSGNNSRNDTNNEYVYGYNSSTRAPSKENVLSETGQFSQNGRTTDSGQDVHTHMGTDRETRHGKGNIGVTTYGKMISEELELRPKLDMYKFIVTEFKEEFCIMVY